jgi:hypothetical protein
MKKHLFSRIKGNKSGQSFVELMLVTLILALMLSGVVEFGFLLNTYLKVLDGGREAARFSSSSVAFNPIDGTSYQIFYVNTVVRAMSVMSPAVLNGNRGDDILVSLFTVSGSNITRWPAGYNGWSLCDNFADTTLRTTLQAVLPYFYPQFLTTWNSCSRKTTHFTTAQIQSLMDTSAPGSGVLLVEIYYNYPQMLKLPVFEQVIPDPIPVYTYTVMPIFSAEPTATP